MARVNVNGTIAPGDGAGGPGTLTVNGSLGNSPTYDFAIGTVSDQIVVSNNLDLSGTLNITTLPGVAAGAYTRYSLMAAVFSLAQSTSLGLPTLNTPLIQPRREK